MISFELKVPTGPSKVEEMEVFLDDAGICRLVSQLQLLKDNRTDHIHLMSEIWGGNDLVDDVRCVNNTPIRHVKVYKITSTLIE